MMKTPLNYSDWVECLDAFKMCDNDEELISLMEKGELEWTSGVAERFTKRVGETLDFRLNVISEGLQNELNRNLDYNAITRVLVNARSRMKILFRLANIDVLPTELKESYTNILRDSAAKIQSSLENSAKRDRTGKMSDIIRRTKLTNIDFEQETNSKQSIDVKRPRRRVIL